MWNYSNSGAQPSQNQGSQNQPSQNQGPQNQPPQNRSGSKAAVPGKSKGVAIFCGLIPGAGHMYLGKMKRGLTLMLLFWGDIALAAFLGMGMLLAFLPVLWFYAFFDNLNLASLPPEELEAVPDDFFFSLFSGTKIRDLAIFRKQNSFLGWGCIFLGIIMLFNIFARGFLQWFTDVFGYDGLVWEIYYKMPQALVAVLVIVLGVHFMKGDRKSRGKEESDDMKPYGGQ